MLLMLFSSVEEALPRPTEEEEERMNERKKKQRSIDQSFLLAPRFPPLQSAPPKRARTPKACTLGAFEGLRSSEWVEINQILVV